MLFPVKTVFIFATASLASANCLIGIRRDSSGILASVCIVPGNTGTVSYLTEVSVYFGTSTSCGVSALSGLDPKYSLVRVGTC
ncbi:hypothetical protein IFR05_003080 [Cadophora sp. M221]|nr:hypothetical protein IFR05_003080 [Cadophora sp. M221]